MKNSPTLNPPRRCARGVSLSLALLLGVFAPAAVAQDAASVRGRLSVTHAENYETGQVDVSYRIEQAEAPLPGQASRTFPVEFDPSQVSDDVTHGTLVEVAGTTTPSGALSARSSEGGQLTVIGGRTATAPPDDQRTIVMLINYQDLSLDLAATPAAVDGIMFHNPDSIDALYRQLSGNKLSFSGDVIGPFTVPYDSTSTNYYDWAYSAEAQAQAMGVDLSLYTRRVFVTPPNGTGYGGVANFGGTNTRAWVFRWANRLAYAHELGHNLSLGHATTPTQTYGDRSSFMGNGDTLKHCNVPHKLLKGWLPTNQIQDATSGTYTLKAVAEPGGGLRALRIPVSGDDDVYVSFRNFARFDCELAGFYAPRTSVHTWGGGSRTTLHQALRNGDTYSADGITITQISHDGISATVSVSLQAIARAPEVRIAPPQGAAQAGVAKSYFTTVINHDSGVSSPTTFNLAVTGQATNWTYTVSPASVTLEPGQSQSVEVRVTPLAGILDTSVNATVFVTGASPVHSVNASFTHHVDSTAPTAPTALQASVATAEVKLVWTSSTDARAGLGLDYTIWRNGVDVGSTSGGSLVVGRTSTTATTQLTYSDRGIADGTYTYEVSCTDAAGNESQRSNAVTVVVGNPK